MKKENFQDKANKILLANPEQSKVIIVENGQCFFSEVDASNYHSKMKFEKDPEVFFREGDQPEDDLDLQEALQQSKSDKEDLEELVAQITDALDPEVEISVNQETPEQVADIVKLREALQSETEKNEELQGELETEKQKSQDLQQELDALKQANQNKVEPENKKEDAKTKTDNKKA